MSSFYSSTSLTFGIKSFETGARWIKNGVDLAFVFKMALMNSFELFFLNFFFLNMEQLA